MTTKTKDTIIYLAAAFLITFGLFVLGSFSASDILLTLIFAGIFLALAFAKGLISMPAPLDKRGRIVTGVTAFIWTASYLVYAGDKLKGGLENKGFAAVYYVLAALGIFALTYMVLGMLTRLTLEKQPAAEAERVKGKFDFKHFFVYAAVLFVCMLPPFLLNWPGTLTNDSFEQLLQAQGNMAYSDHHPWAHTMVISLFYNMGYGITQDVYTGIAVYILAQMLLMALAVAYGAAALEEESGRSHCGIFILLAYILYPYHLAYAITMWKDILFSAAVLILTVTVYRILKRPAAEAYKIGKRDMILLFVSGMGTCLLRHNGLYAYILTMFVIILCMFIGVHKNKEKRFMPALVGVTAVTLCLAFMVKGPLQSALGVTDVDYALKLTIPLQQVARTICDGGEISNEDMEMIGRINTIEYIKNNYIPEGADNMTQWLVAGDEEYLLDHKGEYLALWIRIGLDNPDSYINAYLEQTKGYYTTMMPQQIAFYGILDNDMELETKPLCGAHIRIKIDELISKLQDVFPVYGSFYSMGACFLILLWYIGLEILRKRSRVVLSMLPVLTLTLTILIATPLVADLRYAYPLMLCFPTLTLMEYLS